MPSGVYVRTVRTRVHIAAANFGKWPYRGHSPKHPAVSRARVHLQVLADALGTTVEELDRLGAVDQACRMARQTVVRVMTERPEEMEKAS